MTGRSVLVLPGARAIAQFVSMPPRAAETKEPLTNVVAAGRAGSSGGGGGRGGGGAAGTGVRDRGPADRGPGSAHRPQCVGPCRTGRRADAQTQYRATADLCHARHHAIGARLFIDRRSTIALNAPAMTEPEFAGFSV